LRIRHVSDADEEWARGGWESDWRVSYFWFWLGHDRDLPYVLILMSVYMPAPLNLAFVIAGTGIVNMGRAIANGHSLSPYFVWTAAMALGGLVAGQVS